MPSPSTSQRFTDFAHQFMATHDSIAVDGDYYGLAGTTVYHTATQPLAGKGRIEVNLVSPEAASQFEWTIEITINDKLSGQFVHLIVRREDDAVETYGKTVLPIDTTRADAIFTILGELQSPTD